MMFKQSSNCYNSLIKIYSGTGCHSGIGRPNYGWRKISIGSGCETVKTIAHELLHALGFWHMHMRPDREESVHVEYRNIEYGLEHQFNKMDKYRWDSKVG